MSIYVECSLKALGPSVTKQHHFYAPTVLSKNFDVAPAPGKKNPIIFKITHKIYHMVLVLYFFIFLKDSLK
jgi:hypothetical protein